MLIAIHEAAGRRTACARRADPAHRGRGAAIGRPQTEAHDGAQDPAEGDGMNFRLSKQQDVDWQKAIGKARAALDTVSEAVGAYNTRLNEVRDMAMHMSGDWRRDYDARSQRWQNSHRGQSVNEWIEAWENYEPTEADDPDDSAITEAEELPVAVEA
jgi:hypothetical protein